MQANLISNTAGPWSSSAGARVRSVDAPDPAELLEDGTGRGRFAITSATSRPLSFQPPPEAIVLFPVTRGASTVWRSARPLCSLSLVDIRAFWCF